jgi:acyl-CoA synthetase (NDP forming)
MTHGVAIVGASDKNFWSRNLTRNLARFDYAGEIWPVNPNYPEVGGRPAVASLLDIDGDIDAVVVAVAAHRCPEVVRQAVARGVEDIVVVADGFAERTPHGAGAELQREMVEACTESTRMYGPNCVGFADFRRNICLVAQPVPDIKPGGTVSVISQSGALLTTISAAILEDGGGIDWALSLGNAAQFDLARAIDYACSRGTTRSLAIYAESLGSEPERMRAALEQARSAGVAVVMLKTGRSELSTRIAYSHTASVAGDDAQIDAFLSAFGVIRVDSLEELARVAVLAPMVDRSRGDGVVVIGSSGGQAAISGDLALRDGLHLAELTAETTEMLQASVEPGSFIDNPLDLVGRPGARRSMGEVFEGVYADPNVGFALSPWSVIFPDESPERNTHRDSIKLAVETARATATPTVITSLVNVPWTDWILELRDQNPHVAIVRGLETTIRALSRLFVAGSPSEHPAGSTAQLAPSTMIGELEGRAILTALGVPVIAGTSAITEGAAVEAIDSLRAPVVLKVDVEGITHKAKLGLVSLGLGTRDDVIRAIEESKRSLAANGIPTTSIKGYLVEEMAEGAELLIGLSRSGLGAFLTVAPGGINAAAGVPAETALLPTDDSDIRTMITRFAPSDGAAAGLDEAVAIVSAVCHEFVGGGLDHFDTVELNPMMVSADRAHVVDVLLEENHDL